MTAHLSEPLLTQRPRGPLSGIYAGNARAVIGRGMHVMRRNNLTVVVSGFFEPIFYLLSMGIGLGALIGGVLMQALDERPLDEFSFRTVLVAAAGAVLLLLVLQAIAGRGPRTRSRWR